MAEWVNRVVARARELPGVVSAGATSRLPFAGSRFNPNRSLQIEGQPPIDGEVGRWAVDYTITPGLLDTPPDAQSIFYPDLRANAPSGTVGDPRGASPDRAGLYLDAWVDVLVAAYEGAKKRHQTNGTVSP